MRLFGRGRKNKPEAPESDAVASEPESAPRYTPGTAPSCRRCGRKLQSQEMGGLPGAGALYSGVVCQTCGSVECSDCKGDQAQTPCSWCSGDVSPAWEQRLIQFAQQT